MKYLIIIISTFVIMSFSMTSFATDASRGDEITKLRQKITELENRIKELEVALSKYQEQEKNTNESDYGWQNRKNWRKLSTGMKTQDVLSILGEPTKIIEGVKTLWYYPDIYRGYVSFDDKGNLTGWHEP